MPLLPAGLGPRDAALTVALTPVLGPGAAALLALALRVVSFGAELLAVAVAELAALVLARRERAAGGGDGGAPDWQGRRADDPQGAIRRRGEPAHDRRRADLRRARVAAALPRALRADRLWTC